MAYIKLKTNEKLFIEHHSIPQLFHSKDGWKIEPGVQKDGESKRYTLYNPAGEIEDVTNYDIFSLLRPKAEDWTPVFITFYLRHDRDRHHAVKWSPAHFTPGTVVQTKDLTGEKDGVFTVKAVEQNGPDSYIIETTTAIQEGYFQGEPLRFNISFVEKIISRPAGKAKLTISSYYTPSSTHLHSRHGKDLISLNDLVGLVYDHARQTGYNVYGRESIDYSKLMRRLIPMGLVHSKGGFDCIIKRKPALKFLKKNLHWAFCTVKEAIRIEKEYMDRSMDFQDDLDSDLDLDGLYGTETRDEMLA